MSQFYPNGPIKGWYATGPDTAFMVPQAEYFDEKEAMEYVAAQSEYPDEVDLEDVKAGWYHRLTAPGYLDCTEWSGPFPTFYRAMRDCLRFYEVYLDGRML